MPGPFYEVLGLEADADAEAVDRAYREAVTDCHPDVADDPDATKAFRRLTVARDVLSDEMERARYDRLGHDAYVRRHGRGGPWADSVDRGPGRGPTPRARTVAGGTDGDRVREATAAGRTDPTSPDRTGSADPSGPSTESTVSGTGAAYYSVGERLRPSRRAPTRLDPLGTLRRIGVWAAVDAFLVGAGVATAWLLVSWGEASAVSVAGALLLLTVVTTTAAVHLGTRAV